MNGDGAVTAYDAHLFLNLLQEATILVPANGKAEVVCHIRLLDRSALNTSYPTGAYVEGYVRVQGLATDEGAAGTSHSIPVLGYYGSWSEPSMYDVGSLIDRHGNARALSRHDEQLWLHRFQLPEHSLCR